MDRYPAQRIRAENGELIWILDRAAAQKLPRSVTEKATYV